MFNLFHTRSFYCLAAFPDHGDKDPKDKDDEDKNTSSS